MCISQCKDKMYTRLYMYWFYGRETYDQRPTVYINEITRFCKEYRGMLIYSTVVIRLYHVYMLREGLFLPRGIVQSWVSIKPIITSSIGKFVITTVIQLF